MPQLTRPEQRARSESVYGTMVIKCATCGVEAERTSNNQKHCQSCRYAKKKEQIKQWAKVNRGRVQENNKRYSAANREKMRENNRRYIAANHDKILEVRKRQRDADPERVREYNRKWKAANREKILECNRKWSAANPDKVKAMKAASRHARQGAIGSFTADELNAKFEEMGNKCVHCGATDKKLTVDHITPLKLGGTNFIDNIQPLCGYCNTSKGARFSG